MKIEVKEVSGVTVVAFEGKITVGCGDVRLRGAVHTLISEGKKNFIVDLRGTEKVDASGVGELVNLKTTVEMREGRLVLLGANQKVLDILQITGLINTFMVYNDESVAIHSFSS